MTASKASNRRCPCLARLRVGSRVYVRACGCTGYLQRAKVRRLYVRRVLLDRPLDVARCAKDMGRRRFWLEEVHREGCQTEGR